MARRGRWPDERIEEALRPWVDRLGRVPSGRELAAEGQASLAGAISVSGGVGRWSRAMGVERQREPGTNLRWTDEGIAAELDEYLAGRDGFPTRAEFNADGHLAVWQAIGRRQGLAYWAKRYGHSAPGTGPRRH